MNDNVQFPLKRFEGTHLAKPLVFALGIACILWIFSVMIVVDIDGPAPEIKLIIIIHSALVLLALALYRALKFARSTRFVIEEEVVQISAGDGLSRIITQVPLKEYTGVGLTTGPKFSKTAADTLPTENRVVLVHPYFVHKRVVLYRNASSGRCSRMAETFAAFFQLPNFGDTGMDEDK